jgi:hypothetical protein
MTRSLPFPHLPRQKKKHPSKSRSSQINHHPKNTQRQEAEGKEGGEGREGEESPGPWGEGRPSGSGSLGEFIYAPFPL